MVTVGARCTIVITVVLAACVRPAYAATIEPPLPRVRVLPSCPRTFVDDAAAVSSTVRTLAARVEQSDLIVFVRCVSLKHGGVAGRLLFITAVREQRYVMIEINTPGHRVNQLATLAHELQHAVEIAEARWVRSGTLMARYYRLVGTMVAALPPTFDTEAARRAGVRAQRELAASQAVAVRAALGR